MTAKVRIGTHQPGASVGRRATERETTADKLPFSTASGISRDLIGFGRIFLST